MGNFWGLYLLILLFYCLGFLMGRTRFKHGKILVNTSDPDRDVYSIMLDIPINEIPKRKVIVLGVEIEPTSDPQINQVV